MAGPLFIENQIDLTTAVVEADSTPADLGVERIKDPRLSAVCRLNGADKIITIDWGANKTHAAFALASAWFVKAQYLLGTDAIRIAYDADGGTIGAGAAWEYEGLSGIADYVGVNAWIFDEPISARYLTFQVVDRLTPVDISRLGSFPEVFAPAVNVDFSLVDAISDSTIGEISETANTRYWDPGEKHRSWSLNWQQITESEADKFREIRMKKGLAGQLFFSLYDDPALLPKFGMFCTFSQLPQFKFTKSGFYGVSAAVDESN